jgi:transposase-like protein
MQWPVERVEDIDPKKFRPPFCPNPQCRQHSGENLWFKRHGTYSRKCDGRVVQRWMCRVCGRLFSQQTFALTYYLKKPEHLADIAAGAVAGSANRQIARSLKISHSTVTLQLARLARHAMLLHLSCLGSIKAIEEPIVYDDFESFVFSQDHAYGMGTPIGQMSRFLFGLDYAPHRIGRRRRSARRRVGKEHRRPGAYARSFRASLDRLLAKVPQGRQLELITDGHLAYKSVVATHPERQRICHRVYPNPRRDAVGSRKAKVRHGEMYVVDALHKFIRHTIAHHRRETIAFGRRLNAAIERAFVFLVWRNLIKGFSERKPDRTTSAMRLGLCRRPWDWARILTKRLFPSHWTIPARWWSVYCREIVTEVLGPNTRHSLINAF